MSVGCEGVGMREVRWWSGRGGLNGLDGRCTHRRPVTNSARTSSRNGPRRATIASARRNFPSRGGPGPGSCESLEHACRRRRSTGSLNVVLRQTVCLIFATSCLTGATLAQEAGTLVDDRGPESISPTSKASGGLVQASAPPDPASMALLDAIDTQSISLQDFAARVRMNTYDDLADETEKRFGRV